MDAKALTTTLFYDGGHSVEVFCSQRHQVIYLTYLALGKIRKVFTVEISNL